MPESDDTWKLIPKSDDTCKSMPESDDTYKFMPESDDIINRYCIWVFVSSGEYIESWKLNPHHILYYNHPLKYVFDGLTHFLLTKLR